MRLALSIGLLGGLGSVCRWWLSTALQRRLGPALATRGPGGWWPLAAALPVWTFVVNALGSVAIGVVMGFFLVRAEGATGGSPKAVVALTSGFLGGFTTYSSFAFETVRLLEQRSFVAAALNVGATVVVCLLGCALGLLVGRAAGR